MLPNLPSSYLHLTQPLIINKQSFSSRLLLGTGKYKSIREAIISIKNSSASIVTVAIRRAYSNKLKGKSNLVDGLDWKKLWLLPNTAGCETVEEAIRMAFLGREIARRLGQLDNNFIKLEVIADSEYLFPDPYGTLKAAEYLVNKNFTVLPYVSPDPILAKQLEEVGCSAVMPLGSPIGSGQGLQNLLNLQIIINNARIPIIIDAGIGSASEASQAMEMGASGVLLNTAVAKASNPEYMAEAMKLGVISGRISYISGRMLKQDKAIASSPLKGVFTK
uniref:Thiazole synthase n=1 Tax=Gracilaria vermiculophylla TaxID=2608709 RepID=A0A345U8P6_9FLOR|nr:Thiamine biosynthesis protein G [Gracilaria vermiculophylla]AXI96832.1 Thiamine biosynthesis protein G [Gracilaria vermiculophylla]QXU75046.1 Thiamine biosynthesis protein G [Gracilaria vermiculophylla]WDZ67930.1 Thiamine biosynthesis protein G [Gracilaria vermiculophylla]